MACGRTPGWMGQQILCFLSNLTQVFFTKKPSGIEGLRVSSTSPKVARTIGVPTAAGWKIVAKSKKISCAYGARVRYLLVQGHSRSKPGTKRKTPRFSATLRASSAGTHRRTGDEQHVGCRWVVCRTGATALPEPRQTAHLSTAVVRTALACAIQDPNPPVLDQSRPTRITCACHDSNPSRPAIAAPTPRPHLPG